MAGTGLVTIEKKRPEPGRPGTAIRIAPVGAAFQLCHRSARSGQFAEPLGE